MRKRPAEILLLLAVLFVLPGPSAHAWMRAPYEDAVIAERSELIVVARLKPETIRCVEEKAPNTGGPREFHATLLVSQVIKGKLETEGIPVLLQYESQILGLTVDGLGEVRIMVPQPLAERARLLIAA